MPTYEYLCRECGTRLEVVQSFSDAALTVCDECGGQLRKLFSAAGLIFKGSGWHIKDYSGSGSSSSKSSEGSSSTDAGGTSAPAAPASPSTSAAPAAPAAPAAKPASNSSGSSNSSD